MNTDLIAEFDTAVHNLEALGAASLESPNSIETRLSRDLADLRLHGLESWHPRWIHAPLRAIRAVEGLRLKLMVEAEEVKQELRELQAQLSLLREAGRTADAEFAARPAVRLLCHEADVRDRLNAPMAHLITNARNGIARILEVSLRHAGHEAMRLAAECGRPGADPGLVDEAFRRADLYNKLVAEAHRVTGGVDVPIVPPDQVARLKAMRDARSQASKAAETGGAPSHFTGETIPSFRLPEAVTKAAAGAAKPGPRSSPAQPGPKAAAGPRPAPAQAAAPRAAAAPERVLAATEGRPKDAPKTKPSLPRLRGVIAGAV
jgi:hypothetical protein